LRYGIEGIVAKRADSPYRRGRTSDWVKIRTPAGMDIQAERGGGTMVRADMYSKQVLVVVILLFALTGCTRQTPQPPAPIERFRLVVTPDGKTLRLDSQTGQVAFVTEKGVRTLPVNERIQLEVGQVYVTETGELVAYEADEVELAIRIGKFVGQRAGSDFDLHRSAYVVASKRIKLDRRHGAELLQHRNVGSGPTSDLQNPALG
jgi:hypothetical protein